MTRYYVTLTWDNWPEGGSYGEVVEAETHDEAETIVRRMMAASRAEDIELCYYCGQDAWGGEGENGLCGDCADMAYNEETGETAELEATGADIEQALADCNDQWHLVDCYDLDLHIRNHMPVFRQIAEIDRKLNAEGTSPDGDTYNQVFDLFRPWLPKEGEPAAVTGS